MENDSEAQGLSLRDVISRLIDETSSASRSRRGRLGGERLRDAPDVREEDNLAAVIADDLIRQALSSGFELGFNLVHEPATSGSTALQVLKVSPSIPLVVKVDKRRKLVEEAEVLRHIQDRSDLPLDFRRCFPKVLAIRATSPIYAYLMEQFESRRGYRSAHEELLDPETDARHAVRVTTAVLDRLLAAYEASRNPRLRVSIMEDYVSRIAERLNEAAALATVFQAAPVRVTQHGRTYLPWTEYVKAIDDHATAVEALAPPFVTFVHGDPNPENVIIRITTAEVDVKFIDVKEWRDGDYMFDITKFLHYLEVTAPAEKLSGATATANVGSGGDPIEINHHLSVPSWVEDVKTTTLSRVRAFATDRDPAWELRYSLGMAATLLGVPATRERKGLHVSALSTYAEGLRYLDDFCRAAGLIGTGT